MDCGCWSNNSSKKKFKEDDAAGGEQRKKIFMALLLCSRAFMKYHEFVSYLFHIHTWRQYIYLSPIIARNLSNLFLQGACKKKFHFYSSHFSLFELITNLLLWDILSYIKSIIQFFFFTNTRLRIFFLNFFAFFMSQ